MHDDDTVTDYISGMQGRIAIFIMFVLGTTGSGLGGV
jgi:hypothetical protein